MLHLFKLIGSVLSGWLAESLGRKKAMFIVNLPHLISWTILYYSTSPDEVFIAISLLGFSVGLMVLLYLIWFWKWNFVNKFDLSLSMINYPIYSQKEAPMIIFCGEICEASVRDVLTSLSGIASSLGLLCVYLLANLTDWRNVALLCLSIPITTMVAIYFVSK